MKKLLCTLLFTIVAIGFTQAQSTTLEGGSPLVIIATDASNVPSTTDDTDFGSVDVDTGGLITHTFRITNTSASSILLGFNTVITNSGNGFSNGTINSAFLASGAFTDFTVDYDPSAPVGVGVNSATISLDVNILGAGNETVLFNVQGIGTQVTMADIQVTDDTGNNIVSQDAASTPSLTNSTDFGDVVVGSFVDQVFVINNLGNANLTLTGNPIVDISGGNGDYTVVQQPAITTLTPNGTTNDSTTFTIRFQPSSSNANPIQATVLILNDDPDLVEQVFLFNLTGNGLAAEPEIDVQGLGISIPGDASNTPSATDDTFFGQVDVNTGLVSHVFTILNTGNADLNLTGSPLVSISGGNGDFTVTQQPALSTITGPNGSTTFQITFDPSTSNANPIQAVVLIQNNDSNESAYLFNISGDGLPSVPEMDLLDNANQPLASGGSDDFGQADLSTGNVTHTYTIENNGTEVLNLTDPSPFISITGANASDFTLSVTPSSPIAAAGNTTFAITFNPSALGIRTASVSIANDDSNENPYIFDIQGEGIDANTGSPLLITQYYEGIGVNDKWIEVKNITSGVTTLPGAYHLALFEDLNGTTVGGIATNVPDVSVSIPGLSPGEVVLFRRSGATLTNTAAVSIVDTEVCRFNGNDIVLISTSNGANTYNDRIDIMGVVGNSVAVNWGTDTSLIKGCGTNEAPTIVYDPTNIAYDPLQYITLALAEVDNATANTNLQLGTQTIGPTTWAGSWDNNIPDKTKDAIINGAYTNIGSLDACNLTINGGAALTLDSGSTSYASIEHNLTVAGTFTIGDTESLVVVDPDGVMSGAINKNERSAALNNFRDFTYWSSPVSTTIGQAFSGVDPNRIFEFDTPNEQWVVASGSMVTAKGYISEAPSSTPDGGTHSLTFSGTPNNGTLGKSIDFINDGDPNNDFNLIGNPYPSSIDIEKFILLGDNGEIRNNSAVDGTVWLWTHVTAISNGTTGEFLGDDYATYNLTGGVGAGAASGSGSAVPTKNIGSGQGFFVKAVSSGTVFFQNDMRLKDQNTQFFRAPDAKSATVQEKDRIWLHAESATGGAYNQLLVGFFDKATDGVDRGYDGERLSAAWINFYSTIDSVKYASQGLGTFNVDKKIPLGFDTFIDQPMTYKISIDNIEGILKDNEIYLVDHDLDIVHDLRLADYEFDVDGKGNFLNRFTLQFNKSVLGVDDLELNNNFVVINEENALRLKSSTVITNIKVYDMTGRLLIDKKPNDSEFTLATSAIRKGTVLILNATFDNGAEVSKKAIKY